MSPFSLTRRSVLLGATSLGLASTGIGRALAQEQPKKGGVLTVQVATDPRFLNPAVRGSFNITNIAAKMVEPLVDLGPNGEPEGRLATSWSNSPDGKAITFKLRENVRWHDGKPFTSADVQYCALEMWRKVQNYGTLVFKSLEAVETPDPHTAVFRFSTPMPLRLMLYGGTELAYVVPKHVFEGTDIMANPANLAPIGTGPFKFVAYQPGQHCIVERNPDYWAAGLPYLDRVIWRFIPDPAAATAALEAGETTMSLFSSLPKTELQRLSSDKRLRISTKGNEANSIANVLCFNHRKPELADIRVRQAFVHALDLDFYTKNFLLGFGKREIGPQPSSSAFSFPGLPDYPYDPKKAEALLDAAGLTRGAGGLRATFQLVGSNSDDPTRFATYVQQSLQKVGVRLNLQTYDSPSYLANVMRDWKFDVSVDTIGFRNDPAISTTLWYRSGNAPGTPWSNQWGWKSEKMDSVIDAAAQATDPAQRTALYREFATIANTEVPIWMSVEQVYVSAVDARVRNDHNNPRWTGSHWADLWMTAS